MIKIPKRSVNSLRSSVLKVGEHGNEKDVTTSLERIYEYVSSRIDKASSSGKSHEVISDWELRRIDLAEYIQFIENYPWIYRAMIKSIKDEIPFMDSVLPGLWWIK